MHLFGGGTSARRERLSCSVWLVGHACCSFSVCSAVVSYELVRGSNSRRLEGVSCRFMEWAGQAHCVQSVNTHTHTFGAQQCSISRGVLQDVFLPAARVIGDLLESSRLTRSLDFGDKDRPTVSRRFMRPVWRGFDHDCRTWHESSHRPNLC